MSEKNQIRIKVAGIGGAGVRTAQVMATMAYQDPNTKQLMSSGSLSFAVYDSNAYNLSSVSGIGVTKRVIGRSVVRNKGLALMDSLAEEVWRVSEEGFLKDFADDDVIFVIKSETKTTGRIIGTHLVRKLREQKKLVITVSIKSSVLGGELFQHDQLEKMQKSFSHRKYDDVTSCVVLNDWGFLRHPMMAPTEVWAANSKKMAGIFLPVFYLFARPDLLDVQDFVRHFLAKAPNEFRNLVLSSTELYPNDVTLDLGKLRNEDNKITRIAEASGQFAEIAKDKILAALSEGFLEVNKPLSSSTLVLPHELPGWQMQGLSIGLAKSIAEFNTRRVAKLQKDAANSKLPALDRARYKEILEETQEWAGSGDCHWQNLIYTTVVPGPTSYQGDAPMRAAIIATEIGKPVDVEEIPDWVVWRELGQDSDDSELAYEVGVTTDESQLQVPSSAEIRPALPVAAFAVPSPVIPVHQNGHRKKIRGMRRRALRPVPSNGSGSHNPGPDSQIAARVETSTQPLEAEPQVETSLPSLEETAPEPLTASVTACVSTSEPEPQLSAPTDHTLVAFPSERKVDQVLTTKSTTTAAKNLPFKKLSELCQAARTNVVQAKEMLQYTSEADPELKQKMVEFWSSITPEDYYAVVDKYVEKSPELFDDLKQLNKKMSPEWRSALGDIAARDKEKFSFVVRSPLSDNATVDSGEFVNLSAPFKTVWDIWSRYYRHELDDMPEATEENLVKAIPHMVFLGQEVFLEKIHRVSFGEKAPRRSFWEWFSFKGLRRERNKGGHSLSIAGNAGHIEAGESHPA